MKTSDVNLTVRMKPILTYFVNLLIFILKFYYLKTTIYLNNKYCSRYSSIKLCTDYFSVKWSWHEDDLT